MGYKSRGGWSIDICFKRCTNKDKRCKYCFNGSEFKEVKDGKACKGKQ